ncbi:hypothetical protein BBJ28_00004941 [Nothophytophthora sp. Chile5]|nr:hypothetical protein BBJ28_00004941 [Nothophytophthora sp. Chile5]
MCNKVMHHYGAMSVRECSITLKKPPPKRVEGDARHPFHMIPPVKRELRPEPSLQTPSSAAAALNAQPSASFPHQAAAPSMTTTNNNAEAALEITQQPPETWYKDQNGRKATFDVRVRRTDRFCVRCMDQRHLTVHLLYESGSVCLLSSELLQFSEPGGGYVQPATGPVAVENLAKSINLNSWDGYSTLSKFMISAELDGRGFQEGFETFNTQQSTGPLPPVGTLSPGFPAFPNGATNFTVLQSSSTQNVESQRFSTFVASTKNMSADAAGLLQEGEAELNGDANLLFSLSKVSLSEFLKSNPGEPPVSDPRLAQVSSSLSALLGGDQPMLDTSSEQSVHAIVASDFRHCGFPAFDASFRLVGFYCLLTATQQTQTELRFMPNLYPLPAEMLKELEQAVAEWKKDPAVFRTRVPGGEGEQSLVVLKRAVLDLLTRSRVKQHKPKARSEGPAIAMGKHDFLTPKAIGIRMKGLQKLRWFCQVCQKQCRDENGFKCHTTSEAHQRQMLLVANDPDKFMSGYSEMFEEAFLENLRRRHGTKRMRATHVYNEYIADKLHVHMNATQWETLGTFVQYLGRTGKCVVDETEKGWHIQYIDRDPRAIARQEELEKKKKAELDHEERNDAFIKRQLKIAQSVAGQQEEEEAQRPTKLRRTDSGAKITISLATKPAAKENNSASSIARAAAFSAAGSNVFEGDGDSASSYGRAEKRNVAESVGQRRKRNAVDAIMAEEEQRKRDQSRRQEEEARRQRKENWIAKGIVVKVTNKKVGGGSYYKQKGVVSAVEDKFCATVKLLDSGDVLRLDQDDLETVIPKPGRKVKIVNGDGRGAVAKLLEISTEDFCARIRVDSGPRRGETLERVEYEDICKLADE